MHALENNIENGRIISIDINNLTLAKLLALNMAVEIKHISIRERERERVTISFSEFYQAQVLQPV